MHGTILDAVGFVRVICTWTVDSLRDEDNRGFNPWTQMGVIEK